MSTPWIHPTAAATTMPSIIESTSATNLPKRVAGTTKTYLFGDPIATSLSIAYHNACYKARGAASFHERFESTDVDAFMGLVHRGDCGGSAVTMPHKVTVLSRPEIKEVETKTGIIGASNTLFWRKEANGENSLIATNTDVDGIRDSIRIAVEPAELAAFEALPAADRIGLVVGGGGTTRTAVVTLRMELNCTGPIYIINRFDHEVQAIIEDFASKGLHDIHHLKSPEDVERLLTSQGKRPSYIVNAIPSFEPTTDEEKLARKTLTAVLNSRDATASTNSKLPSAFLEMCYFLHLWTDACTLAQNEGWNVVTGEKCMYLQALAQQVLWQGPTPEGIDLTEAGRNAAEHEQERRRRGEEPL